MSAPLPCTGAQGAFELSQASGLGEGIPWFSLWESWGLNERSKEKGESQGGGAPWRTAATEDEEAWGREQDFRAP